MKARNDLSNLNDNSRSMLESLLIEANIGSYFMIDPLSSGEEKGQPISLAIRQDKYGKIVCDAFVEDEAHHIGEGAFTKVFTTLGTLKHRYDCNGVAQLQFEEDQNKSVMKIKKCDDNKFLYARFEAANLFLSTEKCDHLRARMPSTGESRDGKHVVCTPERKQPGRLLFDVISQDLREKFMNLKPSLTISDRFEISIALFKSLKQQVFNKDLIHRDIKPENIFINKLVDSWLAHIIDYDFSVKKDSKDRNTCGTAEYVAPERLKSCFSEASDIYSMCLVSLLIWGDVNQGALFNSNPTAHEVIQQRGKTKWKIELNMFNNLDGIPDGIKEKLIEFHRACTSSNVQERLDIDKCITTLEGIFLDYQNLLDIPVKVVGCKKKEEENYCAAHQKLEKLYDECISTFEKITSNTELALVAKAIDSQINELEIFLQKMDDAGNDISLSAKTKHMKRKQVKLANTYHSLFKTINSSLRAEDSSLRAQRSNPAQLRQQSSTIE